MSGLYEIQDADASDRSQAGSWEERKALEFGCQVGSNMLNIGLPQRAYGDLSPQSYGMAGAVLDMEH